MSLIKIIRENKRLIELLYVYEVCKVKSRHSKLLYEYFSRKNKMEATFEIEDLIDLFDYELTDININSWSKLNTNILSRASEEINDKTLMYFEYSQIKEKIAKTDRTQTSKIKVITAIAPTMEPAPQYFEDEYLMDRKVDYYLERAVQYKYIEASRFGTIKDSKAYKYQMRKDFLKNKEEYKAQIKLQEWANIVKYDNPSMDGLIVFEDIIKDQHYLSVNNDYKLYNIETKEEFSTSARDTAIKMNKFIAEGGEWDIVDTGKFLKACSKWYTRG